MINIIAAVAKNRAIGYQNKLIYWLPNDLKRFKALTTGHTIIMGRNTFLSLPKGALPNRRNIVLSRSVKSFEGCDVYPSLEEALAHCAKDEEVYIIGSPLPTVSVSQRSTIPLPRQTPSSRPTTTGTKKVVKTILWMSVTTSPIRLSITSANDNRYFVILSTGAILFVGPGNWMHSPSAVCCAFSFP